MTEQHALGPAGGAGRIGDQCDVVGATLVQFALVVVGTLLAEDASRSFHLRKRFEQLLSVGAHAARVLVDHEPQARQLGAQGQHLVDLLLVLGHHHRHFGVGQHVQKFAGDGILVERHRHAAQRLGGELSPIQARTVVAEHGQLVAALEAVRGKSQREGAHMVLAFSPAVTLPDAAVFLAHAGLLAGARGIAAEQFGERIGRGVGNEFHGRAPLAVPR